MSFNKDLPKATQEAVQKAVLAYPAKWRSSVCAFTIVNRETGKTGGGYSESGAACHAGLYNVTDEIVVNAHKAAWQKTNKDFLLWATQESPFSHGVLNRDNKEELLNHAAALDAGIIGVGGCMWVGKAVRHFVEHTHALKFWTELRDLGLDGFQAFIGADILDATGKPNRANSHTSLFCYQTPENVRKYYDEILGARKLTSTSVNRGGYGAYDYSRDWGSLKGKKVKKPDGWGGFVEVFIPGGAKDYADALREIFEGDPKNVK